MNEYAVTTWGRSIVLQWFAKNDTVAREEAEECGHEVRSVRFVRVVECSCNECKQAVAK